MRKACFCGSFDPLTLGHVNVIERASKLFDELVVFISVNSQKNSLFSKEQRLAWLQEATRHLENVTIDYQDGLVVEACRKVNARYLVRGVRNSIDFEYEKNMASMNQLLDPEIETIILYSDPKYVDHSSSNVRELYRYNRDLSMLVPSCVIRSLEEEDNA